MIHLMSIDNLHRVTRNAKSFKNNFQTDDNYQTSQVACGSRVSTLEDRESMVTISPNCNETLSRFSVINTGKAGESGETSVVLNLHSIGPSNVCS